MHRFGNLWWFLMPREHPGELRYRISNNEGYDWADPYARAYRFEDGQEVSLAQASAGHLERWLEVGGQGIAPRTLRVWVPERHPTHFLYVHDGQNPFIQRLSGEVGICIIMLVHRHWLLVSTTVRTA